MKFRGHVNKKKSRRVFRRTSGVSKINIKPPIVRGGVRL